jgi:CheY-like chemotaxis protein/anti-sigma regulatory factor (Ser/Thr protein kinase)
MAAGVAHDFNNVLIGILGYAQLLHGYKDLPEEAKELAGIIKSSAENASELVNRLQWGSSGNVKAAPVPVDLNEVVDAGIKSSRPKWKNQTESEGRSIFVTAELEARSKIDGQIAEVDEVLTNLIFNSVDAMSEGGEITVRTWDEDDEVCLSVEDTGKGMDEETITRLGEMFFTTKGERGHGLGMAVCNRIVEKMSGKIEVISELGKGTRFTLRFPVGNSKAPAKVKASVEKVPSCDVLVIEDDEAVRSLLVLGLPECHVTSASSGSEGIGYFSANAYDVVLLDLSMPEMNGVEVARQLRGINLNTPIVLMTGWSDPLQGEEDQLFTATLPKPFTISQLRECVADLAT